VSVVSSRTIDPESACLECSVYLIGASGRRHSVLAWVRTDQPLTWNNGAGGILYATWWECFNYISTGSQVRVLISDLVVCRSKYLMKVFDLLNRVSQLWWNSHLNSHDGWWKLIMIEGTLLWLTFFSPCHQIGREVLRGLELQKMLFRISTPCESVDP